MTINSAGISVPAKAGKNRYVPLPELTLRLRRFWTTHSGRALLFPNPSGSAATFERKQTDGSQWAMTGSP